MNQHTQGAAVVHHGSRLLFHDWCHLDGGGLIFQVSFLEPTYPRFRYRIDAPVLDRSVRNLSRSRVVLRDPSRDNAGAGDFGGTLRTSGAPLLFRKMRLNLGFAPTHADEGEQISSPNAFPARPRLKA